MSGWVCSYRQIWDHPLFKGDAMRVGVWHWILHNAAWKDTEFRIGSDTISLARGQVCLSHRQVEKATGMGRKAFSGFLKALENENAIVQKTHHDTRQGRTILTVCNYEKYQDKDSIAAPLIAPTTRQTRATKEQGNKLTSKKVGSGEPTMRGVAAPDGFQIFWEAYPHRDGSKRNRKGALAKWQAAIKRGVDPLSIMAGVDMMRRDPAVARGYARDPATWLNQDGWSDTIPDKPSLTSITGGKGQEGELRVISSGRVQERVSGHWEFRNDLRAEDVANA